MCLCVPTLPRRTGVSPSLLCSSKHVLPFLNFRKATIVLTTHTPAYHTTSLCCIPATQILGLGFRVFPFHSPLLRKSWLFSFPPLIKMLQFSGLILFKLRFIRNLLVLVIIKLFLIYYFLTFIFKLTNNDCGSKIINKYNQYLFI